MIDKEKILDSIESSYGFKRDLIKNPELCGLWFVNFEVNGIEYRGSIPFHGALPTLHVHGYLTEHYDENGSPVEDWYYEKYIKGKKARLMRCVDADAGEWKDTGIQFKNQKEADEYMQHLEKEELPNYQYEMIDEEKLDN